MNVSMLALCLTLIEEPDEQEKFQIIYKKYTADMLRAAYGMLKDHGLAEDAVQNALINISLVIKNVDMSKNPRSFAITVAHNEAMKILEKYKREREYIDLNSNHYDTLGYEMHKSVEYKDIAKKAARFVMSLGEEYYEVFMLRFFHDMQYKDIEKVLDVPEATLRKRIQRLKEQLAEYIKGEE